MSLVFTLRNTLKNYILWVLFFYESYNTLVLLNFIRVLSKFSYILKYMY